MATTYMHGGISSAEGKRTGGHTDEPGQALRLKASPILERQEDLLLCVVLGHVDERDEDAEEAKDMYHQEDRLGAGQELATGQVDDQCQT
jgi:hypothetical protein